MHCINCGHKQSEGKFCAVCGTSLGDQLIEVGQTRSRAVIKSDTHSNEHVEKIKAASKVYWSYFLTYLKQPSAVLKLGEKEFLQGIITIIFMAVFVGLFLFKRVTLSFLDFSYELSFFSVMGSSLLFVFISTVIVISSLFLTIKFLGTGRSFKKIAGIYGTQLIPATILVLLALLLLLIKAYAYSNYLLSFALLIAFFIIPLYILNKLLTQEEAVIDPLYCLIAYVVIFVIAFSIYLILLGDSLMGSFMSHSKFF